MTQTLRIALAQIDTHLGEVAVNVARVRQARVEAAALGVDLVVTPEFSVGGYPPEDLVRKPAFVERCEAAIEELARDTADGGPGLIVGGPWRDSGLLFNAAFVLEGGRIIARRAKHELPNYGVFDEKRVFDAGPSPGPVNFRGVRLGLMVCEDFWLPAVSETLADSGAARSRTVSRPGASGSASSAWWRPGCPSCSWARSRARTSWCSTAPASC